MSTERWRAYDPNGVLLGWVGYQNTADVWCGGAFESDQHGIFQKVPIGEWRCSNEEGHGLITIFVRKEGRDSERLRWCERCRCPVYPPHDGYAYHDYGCLMGDGCNCLDPDRFVAKLLAVKD